ncbi:hypothetical protein JCM10908_002597 [Rhodotorula pacifica]|uniref:uncharacterized protein n=1 Tax=Rhodotorula pacifica TaxID=1495444 RepID=UPI003172759B
MYNESRTDAAALFTDLLSPCHHQLHTLKIVFYCGLPDHEIEDILAAIQPEALEMLKRGVCALNSLGTLTVHHWISSADRDVKPHWRELDELELALDRLEDSAPIDFAAVQGFLEHCANSIRRLHLSQRQTRANLGLLPSALHSITFPSLEAVRVGGHDAVQLLQVVGGESPVTNFKFDALGNDHVRALLDLHDSQVRTGRIPTVRIVEYAMSRTRLERAGEDALKQLSRSAYENKVELNGAVPDKWMW